MALLHRADLRPSKLELLSTWLPTRPWFTGDGEVERVATCRFDDPAGAVGLEILLVRAGDGPVHQVPLTYRDAPLPGGDDFLVGTADHSALGPRWVYDACVDPVYAAVLTSTIATGAGQAEEYFEVDGRREFRTPGMTVTGSRAARTEVPTVVRHVVDGDPAVIVTDAVELTVPRRLDEPKNAPYPMLTGTWPGQPDPVVLAYAQFPD
jgi:hypothetical protein